MSLYHCCHCPGQRQCSVSISSLVIWSVKTSRAPNINITLHSLVIVCVNISSLATYECQGTSCSQHYFICHHIIKLPSCPVFFHSQASLGLLACSKIRTIIHIILQIRGDNQLYMKYKCNKWNNGDELWLLLFYYVHDMINHYGPTLSWFHLSFLFLHKFQSFYLWYASQLNQETQLCFYHPFIFLTLLLHLCLP